jgi:hypothetical protein
MLISRKMHDDGLKSIGSAINGARSERQRENNFKIQGGMSSRLIRGTSGVPHKKWQRGRNIFAHLVCWLDVEHFFLYSLVFRFPFTILSAVISDNKRKYVQGESPKKKARRRESEKKKFRSTTTKAGVES